MELYEDQLEPREVTMPSGHRPVEICSRYTSSSSLVAQRPCSNFGLIIRCSDGSLWAVGLGERDRNTCPLPLPVLSDFNINLHSELAKLDIPVKVSERARLRKGYNRVLVLDPERNVPFEVIMHNREAYGREVEGIEDFVTFLSGASSRNIVLDYATGWRHSLAVVMEED